MQSNDTFRLSGKHYLLTYPQCPISKADCYKWFFDKFSPELLLVAAEVHADGSPHLHVYVKFRTRKHIRSNQFFDIDFDGNRYHGNYQTCRSPSACVKYSTKDGDYVSNFEPDKTLCVKDRRKAIADKIVLGKRYLVDLIEEDPELIFGYSRLVNDINAYHRDSTARKVQELPEFLSNPWGKIISSRIISKRRHYWIFSRQPNVGKSYLFAKPLAETYGAVIQSGDFSYWNVAIGVNCIILDEFNTPLLKYSSINSMCDGTFGYRVFQGGVVRLDSPLIIILSNQSISELYPHMNALLYARFNEIEIN